MQCTEKPEIWTRQCTDLVFANRYGFIAGGGIAVLSYAGFSALELTGGRSVHMRRGNAGELWQSCFATHTFYVFYFIKDRKRNFSAICFGS